MNVELLEKVARHIEDNPEQLNMDVWYSHVHRSRVNWLRRLFGVSEQDCNTTACIAGWMVAIGGGGTCHANGVRNIKGEAMLLLGLPEVECEKLFMISQWPWHFRDEYMNCSTVDQRAKVTANRIRMFIERGR